MQILCGTDIIEIGRIKDSIERLESFKRRIYTKSEIEYCESKGEQRYQHYAARFAAKEAIYKAISPLLENKLGSSWTDVEIIHNKEGKPQVHFIDTQFETIKNIDISLSHCKEYAVANVVVLYE